MIKKIIISVMMLTTSFCSMASGTNIKISDVSADAGIQILLPVEISGAADAFQFRTFLPDGFNIVKIQRGKLVRGVNSGNEDVFNFYSSKRDDNSHFILCYSPFGTATSTSGTIVELMVDIDKSVKPGIYDVKLREMECSLKGTKVSSLVEGVGKIIIPDPAGIEGIENTKPLNGKTVIYNLAGTAVNVCENGAYKTSNLQPGVYLIKQNKTIKKVVIR